MLVMKKTIMIISLPLLLLSGLSIEAKDVVSDLSTAVSISRGINMGNMLESPNREGSWGTTLKEKYLPLIKEAGFDHIRVPIRWSDYTGKKPPYSISDKFFKRIDEIISQAHHYGLITIINIHHYEEIMTDPQNHRERF